MTAKFLSLSLLCSALWIGAPLLRAQEAAATPPLNLLPNSSFQQNALNHKGAPAGWTWEGPIEVATISAEKPLSTFGNSLNLNFYGVERSRSVWHCWSGYIPIDPKRSYQQSAWIKTEGPHEGYGASFGRRYFDADKKLIPFPSHQNYLVKNVAPLSWQHFSQVLVPQRDSSQSDYAVDEIPSNARYVRVSLIAAYYPKQVWYNDVRFEPYNPASAPLSYGDNKVTTAPPLPANQKIVVDGQDDEKIWQTSGDWQSDFVRTVCAEDAISSPGKENQTFFKVARDPQNIYFFIKANHSNPATIKSTTTTNNDITLFAGDAVEIFLDATGNRRLAYHVGINPAGAHYEEWSSRAVKLGLQIASQKTASGWQTEVAIPRQKLWQLYNEAGSEMDTDLWNINITRNSPSLSEHRLTSWAYTGPRGFANNAHLGFLLLSEPREILQSKLPKENQLLHRLATQMPEKTDSAAMRALKANFTAMQEASDRALQYIKSDLAVSTENFVRLLLTSHRSDTQARNTLDKMQRLIVELPADRQSFGYALYRTPLFERPNPERIPATTELLSKIQLRVAKNEPGQASFSIFTKADLNDVKINWSKLKSPSGQVIAREVVDVRILETWGKEKQADILATDLRIPLQGWLSSYADQQRFIPLVARDTSRKLWVNVTPELAASPGTYSGTITIEPTGRPATTVPFELTVLPLTLPETSRKVGFYYHGVLARENQPPLGAASYMFYNGLTTPESWLREFKAMRRAGFTMVSIPNYANGPFDPEYTRQILTLAKQAGFDNIMLLGSEHVLTKAVVSDPEKLASVSKDLKQRIQNVYKIAEEIGIKKVFIYGFDEPHTSEDHTQNKIIAEMVHEMGGSIAVAMIFIPMQTGLPKEIDLPIMSWSSTTSDPKVLEQLIQLQRSGQDVMYYSNLTASHTALSRLTMGWYLQKSGFAGNLPWAYYYLATKWEPFTEEYSIHTAYYVIPTRDEPISTLKLEATIAGVTDLRYCELLEKLIAGCKDQALREKARKKFDEMLAQVELVNSKGADSPNYLIPPETLDQNRTTLQQLVLELSQKQ